MDANPGVAAATVTYDPATTSIAGLDGWCGTAGTTAPGSPSRTMSATR